MALNDFLPFATGAGANVENQSTYAADPSTAAGFSAGIAQSQKLNKVWRQSSFLTSGLAQFIANELNLDMIDDGDMAGYVAKLKRALLALNPRQVLYGNTSFYVNATTGNDSYDGLTPTTPWRSLQHAASYLLDQVDSNGYTITVNIADGSYPGFIVAGNILGLEGITGVDMLNFVGNTSNPANVVITDQVNNPSFDAGGIPMSIAVANMGRFQLMGCRITSTTGDCIRALNYGRARLQNVDFSTCPGAHMASSAHSHLRLYGNYSISGGAGYHAWSEYNGTFLAAPPSGTSTITCTITGNPLFTTFAYAARGSVQDWKWDDGTVTAGLTFAGTARGKRYFAKQAASINTYGLGATYLPGDVGGTVDAPTYGIYT